MRNSVTHLVFGSFLALTLAACSQLTQQTNTTQVRDSPQAHVEAWPKLSSPIAANPEHELTIDRLISQMSVEEKVGQIMQAEIQSLKPGDIKKYHLGSVLNGGGSLPYLSLIHI